MVHKKSEYRRTFRWRSPEECHAIWEENWIIRQRLKLQEYQHAPFAWENSENGSDDEESINDLPPSKLHLKHLELKQLESTKKGAHSEPPCSPEKHYLDKEVQTPPWNAQKSHYSSHVSPEKAVQTDITLPSSSVQRSLEDEFESTLIEASGSPDAVQRSKLRQPSPRRRHVTKGPHHPSGSKMYGSVAEVQTSWHPSPFVPYGWADRTREMGTKRTFNINASKNVYPSALQAAKQHKQISTKLGKTITSIPMGREHNKLSFTATRCKEMDTDWLSEYRKSYCRSRGSKTK